MARRSKNFNPRSPSGLRLRTCRKNTIPTAFQSTQPEWAATIHCAKRWLRVEFQSTQPEWAATEKCLQSGLNQQNFNPRSPSGLRRCISLQRWNATSLFQSTQPEWAATVTARFNNSRVRISIHAARVGCDVTWGLHTPNFTVYFNPRSPSGLRPHGHHHR